MVQGWNDGSEDYNIIFKLKKRIAELEKQRTCDKHPFWKPDVCPYCIERKGLEENVLHGELLDLIKLMPDYQLQDIFDFILALQLTRRQK